MRPIIDSHLDLAYNALGFNRDQTESVEAINGRESHMTDHRSRGRATTSLPELRQSGVAVCLATVLARAKREVQPAAGHMRHDLDVATQSIAYATGQSQLAYYRLLVEQNELRWIGSRSELEDHWSGWDAEPVERRPIGVILAMEGADPIVEPAQAAAWFDVGLRCVMLAHYGQSHYAVGTGESGPLTAKGREILAEFEQLGMILDLTHMSDPSFFEALDRFSGPVMASHNNCRALVPGDRQFSDEQLRLLIERGAVIGGVLDAWMLKPDWVRGESTSAGLTQSALVDHFDHICQLAGSANHVALGTDLDGGFGYEQAPEDLRRYGDLRKIESLLAQRGYTDADIDKVFYGNWLRFFRQHLPD